MNRKKKQIIDAAQKLFIKKGFAMTSIQDILNEAQIAKGTFYNYFSSKNECLMAILEFVNEEVAQERLELAHSGEKQDQSVFAKQIEVRFNVDKKHNLMQLFNSVTFSEDKELKAFMEKLYVKELKWLANRFVDIYGSQIKTYVFDHAVTFLGILQHGMLVSKLFESKSNVIKEVIQFALIRTEKIIINQDGSDAVFFKETLFYSCLDEGENRIDDLKTEVISQLTELQDKLDNRDDAKAFHYVQFLLEELQEEDPRLYLLESVFMSLHQVAEGTNFERQVREITIVAWQLIKDGEVEK